MNTKLVTVRFDTKLWERRQGEWQDGGYLLSFKYATSFTSYVDNGVIEDTD